MFVAETEEEIGAELAIELEGGAEAVGEAKGAVVGGDDVGVGGRPLRYRDALGGELRDGLCGNVRKDGHVERNFVVEEADTAADGSAIVF